MRPDDHSRFEFWAGHLGSPRGSAWFLPAQKSAHPALHVEDVAAARADLEAKGLVFAGETMDTGVCHMAFFTDPDGNDLMLHHPVRVGPWCHLPPASHNQRAKP